jgi:hypothetical protein
MKADGVSGFALILARNLSDVSASRSDRFVRSEIQHYKLRMGVPVGMFWRT